jgi:uncharacterized protein YraI
MRGQPSLYWRVIVVIMLVALSLPLTTALARENQQSSLTVTTTNTVNLRAGPGTSYAVLARVPKNTTLPVVGRNGAVTWVQVNYNGTVGWLAAWLCVANGDLASAPLTDGSAGGAPQATTTLSMNLRSGPGTNYAVLRRVPANTTLAIIGRNAASSWVQVNYNGTVGWLAGWLCRITGDLGLAPVTSGTTPSPAPTPSGGTSTGVTAVPNLTVNFRSGPGVGYSLLGRVPGGVTVPVVGRSNDSGWLQINYNGTVGWVAGWLCTVSGNLNSVPVTGTVAANPTPAPATPVPPSGGGNFELGGQTFTLAHPTEMRSARMTWVKFQYKWSPGADPNAVASMIAAGHNNGFRVLLSIPGQLYPASIDFAGYINFLRGVAALGPDAIEVWNEQNLDREWPAGQISPSSYVNNMLAPAYQAIKSVNPNILVIGGALAPTGFDNTVNAWSDQRYLQGMASAGAASYMDCLGVHHNAGATSPDATTGHPADSGNHHYSWYFSPTFNLYANTFPNTRLCFTEFGYLSPEGYGALPSGFWWAYDTSVAEQAQWLARAVQLMRNSGRVRMAIVFNVDFTAWGDDPQGGYAIIRPNGTCPACSALAGVMQ